MEEFWSLQFINYFVIPCLICIARIVDVSLGTLRIIFVSRGMKRLAPVVGFFEILIWLVAIGQIMQNLDNVINYFAYATGFSLGNYLGIILEEKIAMGKNVIRIVTQHDASLLISSLRDHGFSVTVVKGEGAKGPVDILFSVIRRSELALVLSNIKKFNANAFYTIEDIRFVSGGVFPILNNHSRNIFLSFMKKK